MRDPREPLTLDATEGEIMQRGLAICWGSTPPRQLDSVFSQLLAEALAAVRKELGKPDA